MKKHCRFQGNRYAFRLRLLDQYVDSGESYETEEEAAFSADLAKQYFSRFFHLSKNLELSLDGEVFSVLAHRRAISLSDRLSVEKNLSPGVLEFIRAHRPALDAHAESNRPQRSAYQVLRESHLFSERADIREWVLKCERAECDALAFSAIDSASFFLRLKVVAGALTAALRSLHLTLKTHNSETCGTNPRLVQRRQTLAALVVHLDQNLDYVNDLTANLRAEQAAVESAIATLEANRPNLS